MSIQPHFGAPHYQKEAAEGRISPQRGNPIHLGTGDDLYFAGDGGETVFGGAGDDTINGGAGEDRLKGGGGDDYLYGRSGTDTLEGGDGSDYLDGETGSDYLIGGIGDDILNGGKGHDRLFGGEGRDQFEVWGYGHDVVLYRDIGESTPGDRHDIIDAINWGGDSVDLRRIDGDTRTPGNDAFSWIGDHPFSGVAGELRYAPDADGALLQGDVNGDGVADFEVYFLAFKALALTVDDFKL